MEEQPIEPVKVDVALQTNIKKCSDKQREALKKGREEHHRRAKMYKEMVLQKETEETSLPPIPPQVEPPKIQRQIQFL